MYYTSCIGPLFTKMSKSSASLVRDAKGHQPTSLVYKAPLIQLQGMGVPFQHMAMDIAGVFQGAEQVIDTSSWFYAIMQHAYLKLYHSIQYMLNMLLKTWWRCFQGLVFQGSQNWPDHYLTVWWHLFCRWRDGIWQGLIQTPSGIESWSIAIYWTVLPNAPVDFYNVWISVLCTGGVIPLQLLCSLG